LQPDLYLFAVVYLCPDDKKQTFAWLEKAFQDRSFWLIWLEVEPKFDSLHDDSRFSDLRGVLVCDCYLFVTHRRTNHWT